jgi:hypothetical protein
MLACPPMHRVAASFAIAFALAVCHRRAPAGDVQPAAPVDPVALATCAADTGATLPPDYLAYRVREADAEVTVCAANEGSMKIADAVHVAIGSRRALDLHSDIQQGVLLPRIELLRQVNPETLVALGWWRSPPTGVGALLIHLPAGNGRPLLREQLAVEGWQARIVVENDSLRRIGVATTDADRTAVSTRITPRTYDFASLQKAPAPATRRFWPCEGEQPAVATAIDFAAPMTCDPMAREVAWFRLTGDGFAPE